MLLPDKHIRFSESLLGLGAMLLDCLDRPRTLDDLWTTFRHKRSSFAGSRQHTFDHVVLALDALYAIGAIREDSQSGAMSRCV
jgi:hypothetical protein